MTAAISVSHLILLLPLLLLLARLGGVPKLLCVLPCLLALLLSAATHAAVMDWIIGTAVAGLPIRERIQQCRAALSLPMYDRTSPTCKRTSEGARFTPAPE